VTVDDLKRVQADRGLTDVHVVELRATGFTIAHTDAERAIAGQDPAKPLEDCAFHRALANAGGPPVQPGLYTAERHVADEDSESYRPWSLGWDFTPL
jgi:hypothetical protein